MSAKIRYEQYFAAGEHIGGKGDIIITDLLTITGQEAVYRARKADQPVLLCVLLPLRWARFREDRHAFEPYSEQSAMRLTAVIEGARARLGQVAKMKDEDALPVIHDVFTDRGTLWYGTDETADPLLSETDHHYKLREAIDMTAPVLDALAGLHEAGFAHGGISRETITVAEDGFHLSGFLAANGTPAPREDVQAVSLLLWQLLTGETAYHAESGGNLPASIRNALHNGINDPGMTVSDLWVQLHARKAAARVPVKTAAASARPSLLTRVFNPVVTAIFCLACLSVPLVKWFSERQVKAADVPPVEKLEDVAYEPKNGELILPELLCMEQEEAVDLLEGMGLRVILSARQDNPVVPENCVVSQQPYAGAVLHEGETVTLSVSDGWANYVPDVTNMHVEEATDRLESLGFVVKTKEINSENDAPGTVTVQSAAPEKRLDRGSVITLTVSLGRKDVDVTIEETVEDYVGMEYEKAKALLAEHCLYAMQIETVYDAETPAGVVLSQDVRKGEKVPQGTVINMRVSKGVETTRVPGVVLMGANDARNTLQAAGLKCNICYVSNGDYVMDCIMSQSIAEGELAAVGTEVWLTASIGSASYVISTGGWSGNPLPTVNPDDYTTEPEEETTEEENTATEAPDPTEPRNTETTRAQQTEAPTTAYVPAQTEPVYVPQETEMTAPPAPDTPVLVPGDLEPPPMPQ